MIDSITFDTAGSVLTITVDGVATAYTDRAGYLADHPERERDCDAMDWPA